MHKKSPHCHPACSTENCRKSSILSSVIFFYLASNFLLLSNKEYKEVKFTSRCHINP